jgi:preprotein translocase subunit SecA
MEGIKEESVSTLFNAQVQPVEDPIIAESADGAVGASAAAALAGAAPVRPQQQAQPVRSQPVRSQPAGSQPAGSQRAGPQHAASQPASAQQGQATKAQRAQPARAQQARQQPKGRHAQQGGPARDGAQPETALPAGLSRGLDRPRRSGQLSYSAPSDDGSGLAQHTTTTTDGAQYANVGRNAPCPCGSGRKFKQCHGDPRNR